MVFDNCVYDPIRDVCEVDQFGFVYAPEAFRSGVVNGSLQSVEDDYNGMEDPNQLADYQPKDVFDTVLSSKQIIAKESEKQANIINASKTE